MGGADGSWFKVGAISAYPCPGLPAIDGNIPVGQSEHMVKFPDEVGSHAAPTR